MTRSLSVLSKILGLTTSSNPHERRAAEEKLEKQLLAKGITREQLEQQLDMATVDEEIEAISFRYGQPYKRIDPATATILSAVATGVCKIKAKIKMLFGQFKMLIGQFKMLIGQFKMLIGQFKQLTTP